MSYSSKIILLALLLCSISPSIFITARQLNSKSSSKTLMAGLKLEEDHEKGFSSSTSNTTTCWESLFELRSCTAEVILFFINGETYLGPDCCRAIRTIEHQCWPSMLGALGYTAEEGAILRGYCDAAKDIDDSGSNPPPPSPPHFVNATKNSRSHFLMP